VTATVDFNAIQSALNLGGRVLGLIDNVDVEGGAQAGISVTGGHLNLQTLHTEGYQTGVFLNIAAGTGIGRLMNRTGGPVVQISSSGKLGQRLITTSSAKPIAAAARIRSTTRGR